MRSKLFVPASRPDLFSKALAGAADAICFDLEDAVEVTRKVAARSELVRLLDSNESLNGKLIVVRVNAIETEYFDADLEAAARARVDVVNLPMVESADTIQTAAAALQRIEEQRKLSRPIGILANIESPRGLRNAAAIASAHQRVVGLQLGFADLFLPMGIPLGEPAATQTVRLSVRMAAGEAGIPAYDGVYVEIKDLEGFARDARAARQLGFAGKSCIHPSQVGSTNEIFSPTAAEVDDACRIVDAARDALARGVGALVVDGKLVDAPFIVRAEETLALARRLGIPRRTLHET